MVSEPTVLVVGAGGSIPYGFPSGAALVDQILSQSDCGSSSDRSLSATPLGEKLFRMRFSTSQILEFRRDLHASRVNSIDAFLERRSEHIDIGRAAISAVLTPLETEQSLSPRDASEDWYRFLLNKLLENLQEGATETLTIVTYNYDRSLDHYLYTAFSSALGMDKSAMEGFMRNLPIVHVHGALGYLPWQTTTTDEARAYGPGDSDKARHFIRIIHEGKDDSQEYEFARRALRYAKRVIFLGFGYHPVNVRRLLKGNWHLIPINGEARILEGTAVSLTEAQRMIKRSLFDDHLHLEPHVSLGCCDFLRHRIGMIS